MKRHAIPTALFLSLLVLTWWPAPALGQAGASSAQLQQRIDKLNHKIDRELGRLFRNQVQAAVYRVKLGDLQQEWQKLFAQVGLKRPKAEQLPPPAPNEFRIDEVAGSDAASLEQAVLTSSCKRRTGCRIWAKISFGAKLLKKKPTVRVFAEVKNKKGTTRKAVPAQVLTVNKAVMVVSLPIDKLSLYKDSYEGSLQVLCDGRYKTRSFEFQLLKTY